MRKLALLPFSPKDLVAGLSNLRSKATYEYKKRGETVSLTAHAIVRAGERGGRRDLRQLVDLGRLRGAREPAIAMCILREHPEFVSQIASEVDERRALLRSRPGGLQLVGDQPVPIRVSVAGMRAVLCGEAVVTMLPSRKKNRLVGDQRTAALRNGGRDHCPFTSES